MNNTLVQVVAKMPSKVSTVYKLLDFFGSVPPFSPKMGGRRPFQGPGGGGGGGARPPLPLPTPCPCMLLITQCTNSSVSACSCMLASSKIKQFQTCLCLLVICMVGHLQTQHTLCRVLFMMGLDMLKLVIVKSETSDVVLKLQAQISSVCCILFF
jgi:hypothetical protein